MAKEGIAFNISVWACSETFGGVLHPQASDHPIHEGLFVFWIYIFIFIGIVPIWHGRKFEERHIPYAGLDVVGCHFTCLYSGHKYSSSHFPILVELFGRFGGVT